MWYSILWSEFMTQTTIGLPVDRELCRQPSGNRSWNDYFITQLCPYIRLFNPDTKAYPSQYRLYRHLLGVSRSSLTNRRKTQFDLSLPGWTAQTYLFWKHYPILYPKSPQYFCVYSKYLIMFNPLTPELNPSAQRCLTRFCWVFGFSNRAFRVYMRGKPTNPPIIHSVY
jgi:hypothetical protein